MPAEKPIPQSEIFYWPEQTALTKRVGLYFGSFNPIHKGHTALATWILQNTSLDEVWLVVSPQNPFKQANQLASNQHRLQMARLAVEATPGLKVCDIECNLPTPSYTINTLNALAEKFPYTTFVLLMGADNLSGLPRWKSAELIMTRYPIWVYPRPGVEVEALLPQFPQINYLSNAPLFDVSATQVREALLTGQSVKNMLADEVVSYISKHSLYQ